MNKNYWPIGIFLLAMVVVRLIVLTIKTALTNPVEMKGMCGMDSQYVDENINAITQKRQAFLKQYAINFEGAKEQSINEFKMAFLRVKNLENQKIQNNAKITFFLTRPNTTQEDQKLGAGELVDGIYQSPAFEVKKQGRWQVEAYVEVGEDSICLMQEYLVK